MSHFLYDRTERAWAVIWHRTVWTVGAWFYCERFNKADWVLIAVVGATLGTIIGLGINE